MTTKKDMPEVKVDSQENLAPETSKDEYVLKHPFEWCNERVERLPLRRIKAKDQIAIEREIQTRVGAQDVGEQERSVYLLARVTGKPVEMIEELDAVDLNSLQIVWGAGFF